MKTFVRRQIARESLTLRRRVRRRFVASAVLMCAGFAVMTLQGCGDDDPAEYPVPTPTPTEHEGPPHSIMRVGSTQVGGGKLTVNDVPDAYVVASACLGGSGDDCVGGTVVYSDESPGFNDLVQDDASLPIYKLPDGVEVRIELTRGDTNASVTVSDQKLEAAGQTAVVNTTPHLHNHPVWQFAADATVTHPPDKHLSFRLHADGFESSDEITVAIHLFEGDGDGDGSHD